MMPASEASILLLLGISALISPAYLLADPCTPANVTPGNGSFSVYVRPLSYSINTNYNVFINGTANFTAVQFKALDAANGSSIGQWAGGTGISNCSSGSVFVNITGLSLNEQWTSPGNGSSVQIWAYITQGNVTYILTQELKQDQSTYNSTTPTSATNAATSVYPTSATNTSTSTNQSTSLLSTLTANSTINATTSIISASTINTATTAYTTTACTTAYTTATSKIAMSINPGSSTLSVTTTVTTTYASTANFTTSRTYIQGNISASAPVTVNLTTHLASTCPTSARTKSTATYASGILIAAIQSTYFLFYVIVS